MTLAFFAQDLRLRQAKIAYFIPAPQFSRSQKTITKGHVATPKLHHPSESQHPTSTHTMAKYLLLFLLFACFSKHQQGLAANLELTGNAVELELTPEEKAAIQAEWDLLQLGGGRQLRAGQQDRDLWTCYKCTTECLEYQSIINSDCMLFMPQGQCSARCFRRRELEHHQEGHHNMIEERELKKTKCGDTDEFVNDLEKVIEKALKKDAKKIKELKDELKRNREKIKCVAKFVEG